MSSVISQFSSPGFIFRQWEDTKHGERDRDGGNISRQRRGKQYAGD